MAIKSCKDRKVKFVPGTSSNEDHERDVVLMKERASVEAHHDRKVVFVEDKKQQGDVVKENLLGAISKQQVRDGLTSSSRMWRVLLVRCLFAHDVLLYIEVAVTLTRTSPVLTDTCVL